MLASYAAAVRSHDRAAFLAALDPRRAGFRAQPAHRLQLAVADAASRVALRGRRRDPRPRGEPARRSAVRRAGAARPRHAASMRLRGVDPVPDRARPVPRVHPARRAHLSRRRRRADRRDDRELGRAVALRSARRRRPALAASCSGRPATTARSCSAWPATSTPPSLRSARCGGRAGRNASRRSSPPRRPSTRHSPDRRSRETSAAAVTDGIDSGTGRPYGQRLVLDPTPLAALSTVGERIVLTHEITHLATAAATADITPRWLVEGFAEYVANLHTGQPVATAAARTAGRRARRAGPRGPAVGRRVRRQRGRCWPRSTSSPGWPAA